MKLKGIVWHLNSPDYCISWKNILKDSVASHSCSFQFIKKRHCLRLFYWTLETNRFLLKICCVHWSIKKVSVHLYYIKVELISTPYIKYFKINRNILFIWKKLITNYLTIMNMKFLIDIGLRVWVLMIRLHMQIKVG